MRAAFFTLGQALVDAIAVRMVGDDEDLRLGGCRRGRNEQRTGQECWNGERWNEPHDAPENERSAGKAINPND